MRIAIVDDEQAMREQLAKYIGQYAGEKRLALDTCLFPSGDVLLKSQDRDFDIIVFDIDMPGIITNYASAGAPTGQLAAQAPQSMQALSSIT